jgi:hypothetical protein
MINDKKYSDTGCADDRFGGFLVPLKGGVKDFYAHNKELI